MKMFNKEIRGISDLRCDKNAPEDWGKGQGEKRGEIANPISSDFKFTFHKEKHKTNKIDGDKFLKITIWK